jgi:putative lipoic acid-binding regulatory protein
MQIPELEFPCPYPIKVIGDNEPDFAAAMGEIVRKHAEDFDPSTIEVNASRNGNFVSLRINFNATGREQLDALHQALSASGRVKMVI